MNDGLRIVVGPNVNDDFQVFIDDKDVTMKLMVKSMSMNIDADTGATTVNLECYADNIEILAEVVNVRVIEDDK